jgi:hypothetical protein
MADEPEWAAAGADTEQANVARVYDYWLGGSHNFQPDQDLGRSMTAVDHNVKAIARANRAFLGRAVRFLAASGIPQFLDIGPGILTEGSAHQVAQRADPAARVLYAEADPVAVAESRTTLAGNTGAVIIEADLREPEKILYHHELQRLIDLGQPVGLLLVAVLHFLGDADDPWGIVAALRDALAPGSYLVVSHATNESRPEVARAAEKVYHRSAPSSGRTRSRAEIMRFFDGFDLVQPGLTYLPQWRPDSPADVPDDPGRFWFLAGVARKP